MTYTRSLDDTTVSEMTNPTIFQNKTAAETQAKEENTGVLQETSKNLGTQKLTTNVSKDTDKSNTVPDPFDATSSIFSSGDPFGVPLSETSVFEGPAFADDFFTPLESEASKSKTKSTSEDLFFDSSGDLPLDVVEMASSDEEEGDAPKMRAKKIQTLAPPPGKAVASRAKVADTRAAIVAEQTDDPPLDSVDMDSSDDEPPKKPRSAENEYSR